MTNGGALNVKTETVTVGSTSDAGHHVWDPAQTGIDNPESVSVVGQSDPTYALSWDSANGDRFHVVNVADGSDVASGTDIGTVTLRVEGRR